MTALQRKSFLILTQAETIIWEHRNGWCYWGKLKCFDTALWHWFILDLKQEITKFSHFFQDWDLTSSFLSVAFNCFPLLLLNSEIEMLKSGKYFGYVFYVGCCTKSSCVSVWSYIKNNSLNYTFFFFVFSLQFGITSTTLCRHYLLFCLNIHL